MADSIVAVISATVGCSPSEAFRAWIDPEVLPLWLAPPPYDLIHVEVDPKVGGHYRHDVVGPDGKHVVTGELLMLAPGREIFKSWKYSGPNPAPRRETTFVRVHIAERSKDSVRVTINHSRLRDGEELRHYEEGWTHCLLRQKRLFEEMKQLPSAHRNEGALGE